MPLSALEELRKMIGPDAALRIHTAIVKEEMAKLKNQLPKIQPFNAQKLEKLLQEDYDV